MGEKGEEDEAKEAELSIEIVFCPTLILLLNAFANIVQFSIGEPDAEPNRNVILIS